jgi:hypothetical protein
MRDSSSEFELQSEKFRERIRAAKRTILLKNLSVEANDSASEFDRMAAKRKILRANWSYKAKTSRAN